MPARGGHLVLAPPLFAKQHSQRLPLTELSTLVYTVYHIRIRAHPLTHTHPPRTTVLNLTMNAPAPPSTHKGTDSHPYMSSAEDDELSGSEAADTNDPVAWYRRTDLDTVDASTLIDKATDMTAFLVICTRGYNLGVPLDVQMSLMHRIRPSRIPPASTAFLRGWIREVADIVESLDASPPSAGKLHALRARIHALGSGISGQGGQTEAGVGTADSTAKTAADDPSSPAASGAGAPLASASARKNKRKKKKKKKRNPQERAAEGTIRLALVQSSETSGQ